MRPWRSDEQLLASLDVAVTVCRGQEDLSDVASTGGWSRGSVKAAGQVLPVKGGCTRDRSEAVAEAQPFELGRATDPSALCATEDSPLSLLWHVVFARASRFDEVGADAHLRGPCNWSSGNQVEGQAWR